MASPPRITLIADDLTGAADAAGGIACRGLATLLTLKGVPSQPADALVFTTESRTLSRSQAISKVRQIAAELKRRGLLSQDPLLYKKIDSTLRGHPAEELDALSKETGFDRVLVAPAFPAQGRTTIDGRQLVGGVPLEKTEFGRVVRSSDLRAVFGRLGAAVNSVTLSDVRAGGDRLVAHFSGPGPGLLIGDAETDADLMRLARAALSGGIRLLCGSAGLARAVMEVTEWSPTVSGASLPSAVNGPGLVVAGSRHSKSRDQVENLQARGNPVLRVSPGVTAEASTFSDLVEQACRTLAEKRNVVLTAESDGASVDAPEVAERLAELCRRIVRRFPPASLTLTGGDTAAAVCKALDATAIRLLGEITPGIPYGRLQGGLLPDRPVATKAGGFGEADALTDILGFFRNSSF